MSFTEKAPDVPLEGRSLWRWKADLAMAVVVAYFFYNKTVGSEKHTYGTAGYRCISKFGHLVFFEVQALCFLLVHFVVSAIAEASLSSSSPLHGLYRQAYNTSPLVFVNTAVALFFSTGARLQSGATLLALLPEVTVVPALAFIDFYYVKHSQMVLLMTPAISKLQSAYFVYICVYAVMLELNYYWSNKTWPYYVMGGRGLFSKMTMVICVTGAGWLLLTLGLTLRGGMHDLEGGSYRHAVEGRAPAL